MTGDHDEASEIRLRMWCVDRAMEVRSKAKPIAEVAQEIYEWVTNEDVDTE